MSSFLFAEQEEPFQAQQSPSPPASSVGHADPFEKSLSRFRSNSSAGSKKRSHSPSATSTGLARQPSFGTAGQVVGSSPGGLIRKRTLSNGNHAGPLSSSHGHGDDNRDAGHVAPPSTHNDLIPGGAHFETFDIPERDEESPTPVPPPAWERRQSMIVRAEEREKEMRIQRELQAYQAQQEAERKAREEAEQAAKAGKGLFRRSKSKSALDKPLNMAEKTPTRGSKEMSPNLKVPVTSSRRRPHSMLQMTSSSNNRNAGASYRSTMSDQDAIGIRPPLDMNGATAVHSSEDLDAPLPMPNAAFLNGGYASPGHSPRSSTSSLRGSSSRRSSAYGSPLGLTGDAPHMGTTSATAIPDQSNPSRPAFERPLDTIRQMSMLSERNPDGLPSGTPTRAEYGSLSNGGKRRSKVPVNGGMTPAGLILDESIWPSAPVNMVETDALGKAMKSRSSVSLVSLGRNHKTISRSTPTSPHMVKGKQPFDSLSPVSTRSTNGRNSTFGSPAALAREYMIPFSHREGGYAIAANMHGPPSRGGSSEYGRANGYNRYSIDSGMDEYGMLNRLPGQSTSTSTTSLYQPEYSAPPSSFPLHMATDPNAMPAPGPVLSKTPSPLSNANSPAVVKRNGGEGLESDDMGLQMRTRQPPVSTSAAPPANAASPSMAETKPTQSSSLADPVTTTSTAQVESANSTVTVPVQKTKKELAKEAKEAKERQKAEEKQKAVEAARKKAEASREKKKREDEEKIRKTTEKKAAKLKATKEKEQAKLNKISSSKSKPIAPTLVMPATPLKGRTKDLSAATPVSFPGTPATPAEPVRLIDTGTLPEKSLNAPVKASNLSAQLATTQNNEPLPSTSDNSRAPARALEGMSTSNMSTQSPTASSVKSKRSLFGTLRKKFGASSSPTASTRSVPNGRVGRSTPILAPSGAASLLSNPQPENISETSPNPMDNDKTNSFPKAPSFTPQHSTEISEAVSAENPERVVGNPKFATTDSGTLFTPGTQLLQGVNGRDSQIHPANEPKPPAESVKQDGLQEAPIAVAHVDETRNTIALMIEKARQGGLNVDLHVKYIQDLDTKTDELAYHMTEHLRINGVYWGLVALCLLNRPDALDRDDMIKYVLSCWDEEAGAFGAHPRHDGHILATLSAIQILAIQDALDALDRDRIVEFVISLIDPVTGAVAGDRWGEQDTRFSYIAISILSLIGRLDVLDTALDGKARTLIVGHIARCRNFDGGFGATEGSESHGGQIFVCVAALAILDRLDLVDTPTLAWWISERQLPIGGLNGRPEKLEDVCYSWWNLSALSILGKLHWINREELIKFILKSQDLDNGGIADRPGDWVDVFHTNFGLAGLSLLGYSGLQDIDPVYCMPVTVIERLGLKKRYQLLPKDTTDASTTAATNGVSDLSGKTLVENSTSAAAPIPALAPLLPVDADISAPYVTT